jgi:uncharacterized Zn finger protein (UPF0148 family)
MSDFDREAEREKLREKYERDKQKREASERMSELLLQGATMTNRHCPACQSPVFRYDGRSFCPTCEREVTEDGELRGADEPAAADPEANARESTDPDAGSAADREGGDAAADSGAEAEADSRLDPQSETATNRTPEPAAEGDRKAGGERAEATESAPPTPSRDRRPARVDPPATSDAEPPAGRSRSDADADADAGEGEQSRTRQRAEETRSERGTLRDAERTLVEEVASLTRRAEETRDVGRKRDLLAAAREAAETLKAVRRL